MLPLKWKTLPMQHVMKNSSFDDNATIKIHMRAQKACHEVYILQSLSNISQSTYKG
jgi:hypothetical protein